MALISCTSRPSNEADEELIVPSLHSQSREIIFGAGRDCGAERPAKQRSLGLSVADPSRNPGGVTWFSFGAWK